MNIQQRISKLEQATTTPIDIREPLLIEFINRLDDDEADKLAGYLCTYGDNGAMQPLNEQELQAVKEQSDLWISNGDYNN